MGKCVENGRGGCCGCLTLKEETQRQEESRRSRKRLRGTLKSVSLQMANTFTKLMKCLLEECSEWACWHRVKQKPQVFHLRW